jgi:hypothetical protein
MRLCQISETTPAAGSGSIPSISLTADLTAPLPPYNILSHTWSLLPDQEVTFDDLSPYRGDAITLDGRDVAAKSGWDKLRFCASSAARDALSTRHFWVDTCCIDRANLVELSEAITSMWRWYSGSRQCWVYLEDVSMEDAAKGGYDWRTQFRASRWWTRGWTLQELLAPKDVRFFSSKWEYLGSKSDLESIIHDMTGIPVDALRGEDLSKFSVDERLRWTNGRQTKKIEDKAYCLLGIFDVSMSLRYGEGEKAAARLEAKVRGSKTGEWLGVVVYQLLRRSSRKNRAIAELAGKRDE